MTRKRREPRVSDRIESAHEQVTGVLDNPEDIQRVAQALKAAGFTRDDVVYAAGEAALALIDVHGLHHGLLGRLTRSLQHFGEDAAEYHAGEAEARAGHMLIAVSVNGESEKDVAAKTLGECGVRRLRYWGPWAIEELSS
jgi:hypothetical protein